MSYDTKFDDYYDEYDESDYWQQLNEEARLFGNEYVFGDCNPLNGIDYTGDGLDDIW